MDFQSDAPKCAGVRAKLLTTLPYGFPSFVFTNPHDLATPTIILQGGPAASEAQMLAAAPPSVSKEGHPLLE